ncbi:MAG: isochorismatase family protein [Deltaproteobacteria bacterium]|nr:isochorismatase family protein [Deltaproteobacteria bacterium]
MNKTEKITGTKQVRPALILMDLQNQFMPYMAEKSSKITIDTINWTIALFRHCDYPVIRVYHADPQIGPPPESEAFQFDPAFHIEDSDQKFVKNFPNAFKKTDLHNFIKVNLRLCRRDSQS